MSSTLDVQGRDPGSSRAGFRCDCPAGYRGLLCEVNVDECLEQSECLDFQICLDLVNGYMFVRDSGII